MADVLVGFSFERGVARYRSLADGRFVSRATINDLLDAQVSSAERRLGNLITATHEGRLSPSWFAETMRTELRRLHLQERALAVGGFDRLTQSDYGSIGRRLRDDYARVARMAQELQDGTATLPQALSRMQGYLGSARAEYYEAERRVLGETGRQWEERRILNAQESCGDCIDLAARGWQPSGTLPLPGSGGTQCTVYCRCTMDRREVRQPEVARA